MPYEALEEGGEEEGGGGGGGGGGRGGERRPQIRLDDVHAHDSIIRIGLFSRLVMLLGTIRHPGALPVWLPPPLPFPGLVCVPWPTRLCTSACIVVHDSM